MSRHHITGTVANEQNIYSGIVKDRSHRKIVGREHGYFFTPLLHGQQGMGSDFFKFFFFVVYAHDEEYLSKVNHSGRIIRIFPKKLK
jgi:hypothetical protein